MKMHNSQSGFTLTEVSLSMAVFGFLLSLSLGAILMIFHMYQQGTVSRDVQQNARLAMESMVRDSRLASQAGAGNGICILGGSGWEVFYISGNKLWSQEKTGINPADCSGGLPIGSAKSLMSDSVQAAVLSGSVANNTLFIQLSVTSDTNLLNGTRTQCDPTKTGAHLCTLTTLQSTVDLQGMHQ